jgi:hypothetical protein
MPSFEDDPNASKLIYSSIVESLTQQFENSNSFFFEPQQIAIN